MLIKVMREVRRSTMKLRPSVTHLKSFCCLLIQNDANDDGGNRYQLSGSKPRIVCRSRVENAFS
jgi:hypothetical protein